MSAAAAHPREPATDAPRVEWARFAAARGLRVHPLHYVQKDGTCSCGRGDNCPPKQRGKHPRVTGWQTSATTDAAQIDLWWQRWPAANIGIATGEGSGVCVLDADGEEGRASLRVLLGVDLPDTLVVETGSGGLHAYYQHPEAAGVEVANTVGKLAPKLDVRTERGNLVGPGSANAFGSYRVARDAPIARLPVVVLERLRELAEQEPPPAPEGPVLRMVHDDSVPQSRREEWAGAYAKCIDPAISGSGGHDATFVAAQKIVRGFDLPEHAALRALLTEWNPMCSPPWSEPELRRKVREAAVKGRMPWGKLVRERQERDEAWRAERRRDGRVSEDAYQDSSGQPNADKGDGPTATNPLRGLEHLASLALVGRQRILDLASAPITYVWDGIAIQGQIVVSASGPGEGKTTLAALCMVARANLGEPVTLLGRAVVPAPSGKWIVLVEAEHGEASISRKLVKACSAMGIADTCLDRFVILARKDVRLGSPAWGDVQRMVAAGIVSDILLDTLARVAPGDANDEAEQAEAFAAITRCIEGAPEADKPIVWVNAHTRKVDGAKTLADVSGSAQRTGQADTVLLLDADRGDGGRVLSSRVVFAKLREDPPDDNWPAPVSFSVTVKAGYQCDVSAAQDSVPLETRILHLLAVGAQTKSGIGRALGRNVADVDRALSNLFAAKQVRTVEKMVNGKPRKAFDLVSSEHATSTRRPFSDDPRGRARDEHATSTPSDAWEGGNHAE